MGKNTWLAAGLIGLLLTACGTQVASPTAPVAVQAQAVPASGTLDTSYATGGFWSADGYLNLVAGLTVQRDSKAVLLRVTGGRGSRHVELHRLGTNGVADSGFGTAGAVPLPGGTGGALGLLCFNGANAYNDWGAACAVAERPVVAWDGPTGLMVSRFLPSGLPDASYGTGGTVATGFRAGPPAGLAIQADGQLLVAGYVYSTADNAGHAYLVRLRRDGTPDPEFGSAGSVLLPAGTDAVALVLPQSERPVLLTSTETSSLSSYQLWRFTERGLPDTSFGTGGMQPLSASASALLALDDGRLVVGGSGLWRLHANGTPDLTFGVGGFAAVPAADFSATSLALDDSNRLLVSGSSAAAFTPTFEGTLARFRPNGSLDTSFGTAGVAHISLCPACTRGRADFERVAVLPSGRLLAAGTRGYRYDQAVLTRIFP